MSFEQELRKLLNIYSKENGSDTPDHILCVYICHCLQAFNFATNKREIWYGRKTVEDSTTTPSGEQP